MLFGPSFSYFFSCCPCARSRLSYMVLSRLRSCAWLTLSTLFRASAKTAKITFKRKNEPIMTRSTQKRTAIQAMLESIKLYITMVQPSSVIIWKMLSMAQAKLSKLTIPYMMRNWEWGSSMEAGRPASLGSLQKRSAGHYIRPYPSLLHKYSKLGSYGQVPSSRGNSE